MRMWQMILVLTMTCTTAALYGQKQTFDRLVFKTLPAGWSKQERLDKLVFSNYNIAGSEPVILTVFKSADLATKPEQIFQQCWRQYLKLSDTATAPKPRRQYNFDGDAMVSASAEVAGGPDGPGFYVLTLFCADNWLQPVLVFTRSAKIYKTQMHEWLERFQEVQLLKKKS